MSTSSKLAYLSKYTSADNGGEKKKKKKRKKKSSASRNHASTSMVHDDDVGFDTFLPQAQDDDDDEEEEQPTVVMDTAAVSMNQDASDKEGKGQARRRVVRQSGGDDNTSRLMRTRHDSSSDDSDSSPRRRRRRQRYDSDDDESNGKGQKGSKREYTSDSSSSSDEGRSSRDRQRRRRYDSNDSDDGDHAAQRHSRRRYDSDDDDGNVESTTVESSTRRLVKHDSTDDSSVDPPHSSRHNKIMSTGHSAGLQEAQHFRKAEQEIQRRNKREAQAMVDKHGMGETVYRNADGRRVDENDDDDDAGGQVTASTSRTKRSTPQLTAQQEHDLNRGRVQKQQQEARKREFQSVQESSFARLQSDTGLENDRRDVIREGDPMAAFSKRSRSGRIAMQEDQRPVYKGPAPKPNRFGIRPGYRWDGVDRGNGFEDQVLARQYSVNHKKEQAYRWSSADM